MGDHAPSVHLRQFPATPAAWSNPELAAKWARIRDVRRVVTGALELARADKQIGASLQAAVTVHVTADDLAALEGLDLAEITITSSATAVTAPVPEDAFRLAEIADVGVVVRLAEGEKCARCWQVLNDVGAAPDLPGVCGRCADAVRARPAIAA